MATLTPKTISELPSASSVNDADLLALAQSGSSKSLAASVLASYMDTELGISTINTNVSALMTALGTLTVSTGSIAANSSGNITIPNSKDCIVFFSSAGSGSKDIFICHAQANGAVTYARALSASNLAASVTTNTLAIASAASVTVYYMILTF